MRRKFQVNGNDYNIILYTPGTKHYDIMETFFILISVT